jgi:hypothetical protein
VSVKRKTLIVLACCDGPMATIQRRGAWIARETTHKSDAAAREPRRADAVSRFGSASDPRFRASPRASLRGSVGCPVRRPPVKAEPDRSPYEPSVAAARSTPGFAGWEASSVPSERTTAGF